MKKYLVLLLSTLVFISCEPDPIDEGITLPEMEFGLIVSPDSAYIKLGDTLTLHASIPSILSNGVKIEDGKATIDLYMGYTPQVPVTVFQFETVIVDDHVNVIAGKGSIRISPKTGKIVEIYAHPYGDSIQVAMEFIPLKVGTYNFKVQSMFYEGKKGKTRTVPKFAMEDTHWDLCQIIDVPTPHPGEENYYKSYWFAVTD